MDCSASQNQTGKALTEPGNNAAITEDLPPWYKSYRYRLLAMSFFTFFNIMALRINFNIALVSMVNFTKEDSYNNSGDQCPGTDPEANKTGINENGGFDWSPSIQSTLLGCYFYAYPILQVPCGYLAERYGAKMILGLSQLIPALLTLLIPLVASWDVNALIALRVLMGFAASPTYPCNYVLWSRWAPPMDQSRMVALAAMGADVGTVVASILSGVLCHSHFLHGWPSVFYVFGGVAVVTSIIWFLFAYDSPASNPHLSPEEWRYIESGTEELDLVKYRNPPWGALVKSVPFWSVLIVMTTDGLGYYTIFTCTPLYMRQILKFDIQSNGLLNSLPYIAGSVAFTLSGTMADYIRSRGILSTTATRKLFTLISEGGMALSFIGLAYVECNRAAAVTLLVMARFMDATQIAGFGVNQLDLAPLYAGTLMGITNAISQCAGFAAPSIVTSITHNSSSLSRWQHVFFLIGGIAAVGCLQFLIFGTGKELDWAKERRIIAEKRLEEDHIEEDQTEGDQRRII